ATASLGEELGHRLIARGVEVSLVRSSAELEAMRGTFTVLHLAEGREAAEAIFALARRPQKLVVITSGAQEVIGSDVVSTEGAISWGFAQALALEHPETAPLCIDLDPRESIADRAEGALAAAALALGEDRIALRSGALYVPRIIVKSTPASRSAEVRLDPA